MDSEEIIAYVREHCRFYAADIYSWLRVVLDFALNEEELACSEDGATVDFDDYFIRKNRNFCTFCHFLAQLLIIFAV